MAKSETFHGYAPDLGYEFLRNAIAKNDYAAPKKKYPSYLNQYQLKLQHIFQMKKKHFIKSFMKFRQDVKLEKKNLWKNVWRAYLNKSLLQCLAYGKI